MNAVYVFLVGAWLALVQVSLFHSLQMLLSSAAITWITLLLSWFMGASLGVWIRSSRATFPLFLLACMAPYAIQLLLSQYPFSLSLLTVYAPLIGATALFAGHFFQAERRTFPRIATLFFWENTGFALGLVCGVLGLVLQGRAFLLVAPFVGFLLLVVLAWIRGPRTVMRTT